MSKVMPVHPISLEWIEQRFWAKVNKLDGDNACWEWTRATANFGYGAFMVHTGRLEKAHRYSYEMAHGPIPKGACVLHKCDNPKCVRPDHLWLGTRADNNDDMAKKERHGRNKLTPEQVREARRAYAAKEEKCSVRSLANRFGVTSNAMYLALIKKTFKHV